MLYFVKNIYSKTVVFLLIFSLVLTGIGYAANKTPSHVNHTSKIWSRLIKRLIKDGENPKEIKSLFSSPLVHFYARALPIKITHRERMVDYKKFLHPDRIKRAKKWMNRHKTILNWVYQSYGVPPSIQTSILLVETDLGRHTGRKRTFNILASMAATKDLNSILPLLPKQYLRHADMKHLRWFARTKSNWAYNELKALIEYAKLNGLNPLKIKGSIFGAIGICQFMPSNALEFGVDENGDGKVDLFNLDDALASMANYLRHYGWNQGINEKEKFNVILHYNYSRPYAETILRLAHILKSKDTRAKQ